MLKLLPQGSFFGSTTQIQHAPGFKFVETSFAPETQVPLHAHTTVSLFLVLEGFCAEEIGGLSRQSEPNSLLFHPSANSHSAVWKYCKGRCFNIEISPERLALIQSYAPIPFDTIGFHAGVPNQIAMRLYREFQHQDAASALAMEGMALELLAAVGRSSKQPRESIPPRWLRTVAEFLETRFWDKLSLVDIAAQVDVHPSHLTRVFRQHYRCSIGDYVRRLRMEYICRQLTTSELPLGAIAHAAGFADQSHFTRTFKRHYGITPLEYQRCFRRCTS